MSPFYTTLSLWVGAMLLVSLMRVDVDNLDGVYKTHHIYFGRMMIFLTVGLFQALIVTIGDIFILGTYVVDKIWFVIFALLISIVFITITYTLVSVFGNIGKGIAIIFLVLQFSSSGRDIPGEHSFHFFSKGESVRAVYICGWGAARGCWRDAVLGSAEGCYLSVHVHRGVLFGGVSSEKAAQRLYETRSRKGEADEADFLKINPRSLKQ